MVVLLDLDVLLFKITLITTTLPPSLSHTHNHRKTDGHISSVTPGYRTSTDSGTNWVWIDSLAGRSSVMIAMRQAILLHNKSQEKFVSRRLLAVND